MDMINEGNSGLIDDARQGFLEAGVKKRGRRLALYKYADPQRFAHWDSLLRLAYETNARKGELVQACWEAFDLERRLWTLPVANGRAGKGRRIPLTLAAITTLRSMQEIANPESPLVFHALGKGHIHDDVFPAVMRSLGLTCATFSELRSRARMRMEKRLSYLSESELAETLGLKNLGKV